MTDMATQRIALTVPGMEAVAVKRIPFSTGASSQLNLDAYYPPEIPLGGAPVVIFVGGYPGPAFTKLMGCAFKDMGAYVSWAQLLACSGIIGINYENEDPVKDAEAVVKFIQSNANDLGIDVHRVAIWSCSGNVPTALSLLTNRDLGLSCAVLLYGYTLDLAGHTSVNDMSTQFGFANPMRGKDITDIHKIPTLLVRAGLDELPGLNESMGRFVQYALTNNQPLSVINHPEGAHAFDLIEHTDSSRAVIRSVVDYLCTNLAI